MQHTIIALGAGSGPRQTTFSDTCHSVFGAPARAISYAEFLQTPERLSDLLIRGSYLWIDSPHQDIESILALYRAGASLAEQCGYPVLSEAQLQNLQNGSIGSPPQFYFGLVQTVQDACQRAKNSGTPASVSATDVASAFDKSDCWARLNADSIPIPDRLEAPETFDQLLTQMDQRAMSRVFVKLRFGSAAAGMIALARNGTDWRAVTTASPDTAGNLYASRQVRTLTELHEIKALIDTLAPLGLHVERWLPKIGVDNRRVDVRCVVVDGDTVFPVVRASRHPMTNLHLGGTRAAPNQLIELIGQAAWEDALASVRASAQAYPDCKSVGIDLAILSNGTKHAILEVNAFGDFVKEVRINDLTPFEMILQSLHLSTAPTGSAA